MLLHSHCRMGVCSGLAAVVILYYRQSAYTAEFCIHFRHVLIMSHEYKTFSRSYSNESVIFAGGLVNSKADEKNSEELPVFIAKLLRSGTEVMRCRAAPVSRSGVKHSFRV